jgi:release factor glutamine methyltransferase
MPSDHLPKALWTLLGALQWTTDYLKRHHIDHARAVAEVLLANVLQCERIDLYLHYDQPLHNDELAQFKTLIKRRVNREPEAYIIGRKEFWSLGFKVTPAVLIPRPETECLVETTLALLGSRDQARILELGTGSGAISVALASEKAGWHLWASDISRPAIELARHNACHLLGQERIHFFRGSWLEPVNPGATRFDAIIANPPYVATADIVSLDAEIRQFEPIGALDGGPHGLNDLARIIDGAAQYLLPGGYAILEMGYDQRAAVEGLATASGAYDQIVFGKDYSGHDRVVQLRKKIG